MTENAVWQQIALILLPHPTRRQLLVSHVDGQSRLRQWQAPQSGDL